MTPKTTSKRLTDIRESKKSTTERSVKLLKTVTYETKEREMENTKIVSEKEATMVLRMYFTEYCQIKSDFC